jgi:Flp pilus assembly protein TadG
VRRRAARDDGTAIIEFVFVAVVVMVPLVYFLLAASVVQRARMSVATAAREAGRAYATGENPADAELRLRAAVRLALGDARTASEVRFVGADVPCDGAAVPPTLEPGAVFVVCVTRHVDIPAVPRLLEGRGISAVGRYVVHIDDYRARP